MGERFRAAREARGLSLSDVAEQIRIRSVYLGAIEEENWSAIGAPVYSRGFLRTYARFLGLDPEEVVGEFNRSGASSAIVAAPGNSGQSRENRAGVERNERSGRSLSPFILVASLVAVLLVAFVFYNELTMRERAANPPTAAVSPNPLPSNMTGDAAAAGSVNPDGSGAPRLAPPTRAAALVGHTMQVSLSSPSWLRITVDGNVSMEGTFPAGTVKVFRGKTAAVRIGNAGGVDILIDGKNVGKLGGSGDVVERSFTL
ncbi:MAG: RodZ domain-containing protein [Candidatus Aquilonibacter sp.]